MDDKNRPKILGLGLVAVVAVFMLRSTVDGIVMNAPSDATGERAVGNALMVVRTP